MIREFHFYGVFFSPMLLWVAIALPITATLRRVLARAGFYRFVWHRALFDLALLVIVVGGVVSVLMGWRGR